MSQPEPASPFDHITPEAFEGFASRQRAYLVALARLGVKRHACKAARISEGTPHSRQWKSTSGFMDAQALALEGREHAAEAVHLTDAFCHKSRRRVKHLFRELWRNDDELKYRTALAVLDGKHRWLEEVLIEVELEADLSPAAAVSEAAPQVARSNS